MGEERATIIPAPGRAAETARKLLGLAEDTRDVRTTNGGAEFSVPAYLAELYNAKPRVRRAKKGDEQ